MTNTIKKPFIYTIMQNNILKFQTNIPELVLFKFNDFKEGTGQYGAWYKYTVQNRGVDKVIFAKEALHNKLQACMPLQDKELEITFAETPDRKKCWKIMFQGEEIAGGYTNTNSYKKPSTGGKIEAIDDTTEKMRAWAIKVNERLNSIETRLRDIEAKLFPETGELSRDGAHSTEEDLKEIPY